MTVTPADALAAGQIFCVFQPLVDLASGAIFGYEALARSTAPEFPNPPALIQAGIDHNYCGQLGRALRQMAIEGCSETPLFLNMHPNEFSEAWLVRPDDPISVHDQDIFLEITESVPLSHYQYCHSVLSEIRGRGVKIAVDDLGAGYSNLKYIADLEPDVVKLDIELISGLVRDTPLHRLVTSIVGLCSEMGARVVAEGIETLDELNAVIDTGAHFGQGYFLARPAKEPPTVNFEALLSGNSG